MGTQGEWGHIFWKCCNTADAFTIRLNLPNSHAAGVLSRTDNFFTQGMEEIVFMA